ncbi:MAG: hypothetical protein ACJAYR_001406 [Sneathiella sp.]|jgi:hypothetical protein
MPKKRQQCASFYAVRDEFLKSVDPASLGSKMPGFWRNNNKRIRAQFLRNSTDIHQPNTTHSDCGHFQNASLTARINTI